MKTNITRLTTTNFAEVVFQPHETGGSVKVTIDGYQFTATDLRELARALEVKAEELQPLPNLIPNLTPQDFKVIRHLRQRNSISSLEAMDGYRIRRLAASIYRLKAHGYVFNTVTKYDATGQRYTRYYVDTVPEQFARAA